MATEVRADPIELTRLAETCLDAANGLTDHLTATTEPFSFPQSAFGNTAAAVSGYQTSQATAESTGQAVARLVAVLEGDVDKIYRIAFAYQQADREASDELCRERPGLQPC